MSTRISYAAGDVTVMLVDSTSSVICPAWLGGTQQMRCTISAGYSKADVGITPLSPLDGLTE